MKTRTVVSKVETVSKSIRERLKTPLDAVIDSKSIVSLIQKFGIEKPRVVDLLYLSQSLRRYLQASGGVEAIAKLELAIREVLDYLTDGEYFVPADKVLEEGSLGNIAVHAVPSTLMLGVDRFDREFGPLRYASIHLLAGPHGVGKTQICFQYAVRAFLPLEEGGLARSDRLPKVFYIDTENRFAGKRLLKIAKRWSESLSKTVGSIEKVLSHIYVAKLSSSSVDVLCNILDRVIRYVEPDNDILIIVDSLAMPVYYALEGEHSQRMALEYAQLYKRVLRRLLNLAMYFGAIILTTMHVYTNISHGGKSYIIKGGTVVGHAVSYILTIEKSSHDTRIIRCVKSPEHDNFEVKVKISDEGVE